VLPAQRFPRPASNTPASAFVRTLDELLAIDGIRIVAIATPNVTSLRSRARQCLAAGKDVVIDKPFATTQEEGVAIARLAKDAGRLLSSIRTAGGTAIS